MKVLILSCSTGEGHNSAAKAIESILFNKNIECETLDVLTFKSGKTQRRLTSSYCTVIRRTPALFGLACKLGAIYDDSRLPSPIYYFNSKCADGIYDYVKKNGINCVICTHLYAMEAMTAVRRKYGFPIACYGVLTDYTTIPFYKDTDLDGYFVPTDEVKSQLMKKGFSAERIFVTGIPVHPKFREQITKAQARERLNIPLGKKVVLIMTGGAGCGKIDKLCKKLDRALDETHRIIVLTGRNGRLKNRLDVRFSGTTKFATVEFTPDVNIYLKAADAVITKSGGLSSTEIAVSNVPLIHLKAIPGVETANLKFFSGYGLSLRANTVRQAVNHTVTLLSDADCAAAMLKIQRHFINAYAAECIAGKITEDTENEYNIVDGVYNSRIPVGQCDVLQVYPEADKA